MRPSSSPPDGGAVDRCRSKNLPQPCGQRSEPLLAKSRASTKPASGARSTRPPGRSNVGRRSPLAVPVPVRPSAASQKAMPMAVPARGARWRPRPFVGRCVPVRRTYYRGRRSNIRRLGGVRHHQRCMDPSTWSLTVVVADTRRREGRLVAGEEQQAPARASAASWAAGAACRRCASWGTPPRVAATDVEPAARVLVKAVSTRSASRAESAPPESTQHTIRSAAAGGCGRRQTAPCRDANAGIRLGGAGRSRSRHPEATVASPCRTSCSGRCGSLLPHLRRPRQIPPAAPP